MDDKPNVVTAAAPLTEADIDALTALYEAQRSDPNWRQNLMSPDFDPPLITFPTFDDFEKYIHAADESDASPVDDAPSEGGGDG